MRAKAERSSEDPQRRASTASVERSAGGAALAEHGSSRAEAVAQRRLEDLANRSAQAKSTAQYQSLLNGSAGVLALQTRQRGANQRPRGEGEVQRRPEAAPGRPPHDARLSARLEADLGGLAGLSWTGEIATDVEDAAAPLQRLKTTAANIGNNWSYGGALPSYGVLQNALGNYEAAATIDTTEKLLDAALAFRDAFGLVVPQPDGAVRIKNHLRTLIDETHPELGRVLTEATNVQNGQTLDQRVDAAAGQLEVPRRRSSRAMLRYQHGLGFKGKLAPAVGAQDGPAILQSWRARGDMYHVGAVLNLYPQLEVFLYDIPKPQDVVSEASFQTQHERAERWQQACMIADYYGQPDRVSYTHADGVAALGQKGHAYDLHASVVAGEPIERQKGFFIDVGGCTTVLGLDLAAARAAGDQAYTTRKQDLAAAVAPAPRQNDGRASKQAITDYLAATGWDEATKYVIINYRGSGHTQIEKQLVGAGGERQARINAYVPARDQAGGNHPELDTGVFGVTQLGAIVSGRGFTPVYMGEEPAAPPAGPHLIKYWNFEAADPVDGETKKLCRGGRAAEAFFLRVLAETYKVRLLSMRSGVTDQLAFLGIPTLSIDLDNFHQASAPELYPRPGYELGNDETAHSWARGSKLEAGLQRDYGRVFISEHRDLSDFSPEPENKWRGELAPADVATIDDAVGFYFGDADAPAAESAGVRHQSHPFHPDKLEATRAKGGQDEVNLRQALVSKIDTGLNPEVVLAHARVVLKQDQPDVAAAVKFLDSHLEYVSVAQAAVTVDDARHRATKLRQQLAFLDQAAQVLGAHGGQYTAAAQEIRNWLADNEHRLGHVRNAAAVLLAGYGDMDHALNRVFDRLAGKVRTERAAIALIQTAPVQDALAAAEAVHDVEGKDAFGARLGALVDAMAILYDALLAMSRAARDRLVDPYYRRPFLEVATSLEGLARPAAALAA
jgi:hypothetical protein